MIIKMKFRNGKWKITNLKYKLHTEYSNLFLKFLLIHNNDHSDEKWDINLFYKTSNNQ